jgi:Domain of unknown function (DUF4386)
MYTSRLIPRGLAVLGLIAGPVLLARFVGILFGVFEPASVLGSIMGAPEFIWELAFGIWLIVKGFNPSAEVLSEPGTTGLKETGERSLARA